MKQTVNNGVVTISSITFDECCEISQLMCNASADEKSQSSLAYFLLMDFKQDLIDNQAFEVLADLKRLESLHEVYIPFVDYKGQDVLINPLNP